MYTVKPQQLAIWLMMAMKWAEEHQCELPICEELVTKLNKVQWDDDAELIIDEKPF